ncbi:hypothetical protein LZC95_33315 [Pendulispora brunnea]|uniref:Uncharacterized protein n=1 Tax=Pendulispora brunnea TaxID=2905690 RepID=A0ABZ2JXU8_9BACT
MAEEKRWTERADGVDVRDARVGAHPDAIAVDFFVLSSRVVGCAIPSTSPPSTTIAPPKPPVDTTASLSTLPAASLSKPPTEELFAHGEIKPAVAVQPVQAPTTSRHPQAGLATARSLRCVFLKHATIDWGTEPLSVEIGDESFIFTFDSIDHKKHEARMLGNIGAATVPTKISVAGLTFFERTKIGVYNMTTIFHWGSENGDYAAVTSRHHVTLSGEPMPSQHHGYCNALIQ